MPIIDPLERLRAANPLPPAAVARIRPDAVLFRAITEQPPRRPARRRLRVLAPALAITGLLGGAVAYAALRDGVTKPQSVACYAAADLEARTEVTDVGADGPLAACADLWRRGVFGAAGDAPPLTECVLDSGVAGVFPVEPADLACAGLHASSTLAPPPPAAPTPVPEVDVNDRFLAFRDAVVGAFVNAGCVDPQEATATVRRELDRAGLRDWTIQPGQFTPDRACATLGFRPEAHQIVLVPAPPRR